MKGRFRAAYKYVHSTSPLILHQVNPSRHSPIGRHYSLLAMRFGRVLGGLTTRVSQRHQVAFFHHSRPRSAMKGAHVISWGSSPVFTDLPDLPQPSSTQLQLKVLAVGVPRVVQARAAGKHSSVQNKPLPLDPSLDGVGRDESTGDLYLYVLPLPADFLRFWSTRLHSDQASASLSVLREGHPFSRNVSMLSVAS